MKKHNKNKDKKIKPFGSLRLQIPKTGGYMKSKKVYNRKKKW